MTSDADDEETSAVIEEETESNLVSDNIEENQQHRNQDANGIEIPQDKTSQSQSNLFNVDRVEDGISTDRQDTDGFEIPPAPQDKTQSTSKFVIICLINNNVSSVMPFTFAIMFPRSSRDFIASPNSPKLTQLKLRVYTKLDTLGTSQHIVP